MDAGTSVVIGPSSTALIVGTFSFVGTMTAVNAPPRQADTIIVGAPGNLLDTLETAVVNHLLPAPLVGLGQV